jgi:hypothetical protein
MKFQKAIIFFAALCVFSVQAHTAVAPTTGTGDSTSPYQIATIDNLYWLSQNPDSWNKYFIQTADINASSITSWTRIGNDSVNGFGGQYNGNGHKISNLVLNSSTADTQGLFGYVTTNGVIANLSLYSCAIVANSFAGSFAGISQGTLSNCHVAGGSISGTSYIGGLAGYSSDSATFYKCSNSASVTASNRYVGGIVGCVVATTISQCSNTGNIVTSISSGAADAGGIVGSSTYYTTRSTVINCYNTGSVTAASGNSAGGILGSAKATIMTCCYSTGIITASTQGGGLTGWCSDSATFIGCFTTHTPAIGDNAGVVTQTNVSVIDTAAMKTIATFTAAGWDFTDETINGSSDIWSIQAGINNGYPYFLYSKGNGTEAYPYQIYTYTDLNLIRTYPSAVYSVMANIDASSSGTEHGDSGFVPIGDSTTKFSGKFHGNGHVISGLTINRGSTDYIGLFGVSKGTIDSLGITYCNITGNAYVGSIAGYNDSGTISNCYSTGNVTGSNFAVGGIAGYNDSGTISSCYSTGNITGSKYYVGGITGKNIYGTISSSYSTGMVSNGVSFAGGIAGENNNGTINTCYAAGKISGSLSGGICGSNYEGTISACYWNINTTGQNSGYGDNYNGSVSVTGLSTAKMKASSSFSGFDFNTVWTIREDSTYPGLRTIPDNAPFAFPDFPTSTSVTYSLANLLSNDCDIETLQGNLILKIISASPGATTDSTSTLTFTTATIDTVKYRVGEIRSAIGDTLWGNIATAIIGYNTITASRLSLPTTPKTFSFAIAGGCGLVRYALPKAGFVSLKLYSMNGQLVCEPVSRNMNAGYYTLKLGKNAIANGFYVAAFNAGEYHKTTTVQLTK